MLNLKQSVKQFTVGDYQRLYWHQIRQSKRQLGLYHACWVK